MAASLDQELAEFAERRGGVKLKRGPCKLCASPHRVLYERAFTLGWREADIIALAADRGDVITQGHVSYHFRAGQHFVDAAPSKPERKRAAKKS